MSLKKLRSKSSLLEPSIRIGKNGLTDSSLKEISQALKKRRLLKIRILKSSKPKKDGIIRDVVKGTDSELIQSVGSVFTIYKDPKKEVK